MRGARRLGSACRVLAERKSLGVAVGDALIAMPLYLDENCYVDVPLEATYHAAFEGTPEYWRRIIEGKP